MVARDEVLVRVHAATVNPADWHLVRGQPYIARLSYGMRKPRSRVPGCDAAGQVAAVGPEITTVQCGAGVFGSPFPSCGASAERVRVVEDRLATAPPCSCSESRSSPIPQRRLSRVSPPFQPGPRGNDEQMEEHVRALVDAEWEARLGVERSVLHSGGVHVVVAGLGANDAMSFLLDETCIVVVPADEVESARVALAGLEARAAFTADALKTLLGSDAQVDGPSWHSYAAARSFLGTPDNSARLVDGDDTSLLAFLDGNELADWAESGFPPLLSSADPATTRFWILREDNRVVAAGNMTDWRGLPADVGVLTEPSQRGRGLATRLVGTMVADALPAVGVVRYRALASNVASLALAERLGFEPYGQNFGARRPPRM